MDDEPRKKSNPGTNKDQGGVGRDVVMLGLLAKQATALCQRSQYVSYALWGHRHSYHEENTSEKSNGCMPACKGKGRVGAKNTCAPRRQGSKGERKYIQEKLINCTFENLSRKGICGA